jgi:hypothetical protein
VWFIHEGLVGSAIDRQISLSRLAGWNGGRSLEALALQGMKPASAARSPWAHLDSGGHHRDMGQTEAWSSGRHQYLGYYPEIKLVWYVI